MIRILLIVLLLTGCARSVEITDTITSTAKDNIDSVVVMKPECAELGNICKRELDNLNEVCIQNAQTKYDEGWKKGFKKGIIVTIIFMILAFAVLKRIVK